MNVTDKIIKPKIGLLELAKQLGNVKQGMQQGVLKGKQETARTMLLEGLNNDLVIKCTGLDLDTVLKLKKDVAKA